MTAPIHPRLAMPPTRSLLSSGNVKVEFGPVRRDPSHRAPEFCKGHPLLAAIAETAALAYEDPIDAGNVRGRMWSSQRKTFCFKPTRAQIEAEEPEDDEWNTPIKYA